MIQRLVKMEFNPEKLDEFKDIFQEVRPLILQQKGCISVTLWTEISETGVVFTYSKWETEDALNEYRSTPLFERTWKRTKALFSAPAKAWSLEE